METILIRLKKSIETSIQEEFNNFLKTTKVSKNWYRIIKPKTYFWKLELEIPRTRWKKSEDTVFYSEVKSKTLEEIFDKIFNQILWLMRLWNSFEDIKNYFQEIYNFGFSNDFLSKIYNSISTEILEWKTRVLNNFYTIIYLDATFIKLRTADVNTWRYTIKSVPVYFVIWVNISWEKEILDFVIMENPENAWTWQEIINSLRNRWINDIIFACVDWLKWFKWAILSNFPNAIIQPCIVHKIRNLQKLISYKDRYEFNLEFKKVYNAISEEDALLELNKMNIKWQKYSHILRDWFYDIDVWWQYFKYSYRIRKLIYTTNIIENLNWIIQTNIAKRRVYFTHKSAEISIFLAIQNKQNSLKKISCSQELRLELINFFWERIPKI